MPTYDGSKITTGTLYEDGVVVVKDGFDADGESSSPCGKTSNITNGTTTSMIKFLTQEGENVNNPVAKSTSMTSGSITTTINLHSLLNEEKSPKAETSSILSATIRTSIIIT